MHIRTPGFKNVKTHKIVSWKRGAIGRPPAPCHIHVLETRRTLRHMRRRMACRTHKVRFSIREPHKKEE